MCACSNIAARCQPACQLHNTHRAHGRIEAIMTLNQIVWLGVFVICAACWSIVGFYLAG